MGSNAVLRLRRSAAQMHALAQVEREIRSIDQKSKCRYLRDFSDAFRTYESVLTPAELRQMLHASDVVLVGDYHALPASQRYAANLVQQLAQEQSRPVVLGLEAVFARHQGAIEEWMRGEIEEGELRERIRFDLDWGYAWEPYLQLLQTARKFARAVYGIDCAPRADLRRISARDRHATGKILEVRAAHPEAIVVVLFGESHLAPSHLPQMLAQADPASRVLTVLQNVDTLYWQAAGEPVDHVEAVRVSQDVACVFSASPLEKYESYRLCIDRWRRLGTSAPDLAPSVYNLIDALLRFLNIDKYEENDRFQTRYLVDLLPEVWCRASADQLQRLLERKRLTEQEIKRVLLRVESGGSCLVPSINGIYATNFAVDRGAEEAARFVHHACQGTLFRRIEEPATAEDAFYARVVGEALAYFGARVLCPSRPAVRESELYALYAQPREAIEGKTIYSYREYMEMIDFLVLHKDYEANHQHYRGVPELIGEGVHSSGEKFEFFTRWLGQMLGTELYEAYLRGRIAKRFLRSLFMRPLDAPGAARAAYFAATRKIRMPNRRRLPAAA